MTANQGSSVLPRVRAWIVDVFSADLRSLAALRMALGTVVILELYSRATDLSAHYSDGGVLPRSILSHEGLNRWAFSLNTMSGLPLFQALLFGIAAIAALALLVGYRTRAMSVVVWALMLSIQWRNPLVLNAGNALLRVLLFWGMFLPLGAYWSVDRALPAAPQRWSMRYLSFGTVALFLQIALMYWVTATLKTNGDWRRKGTALYYAWSNSEYARPTADFLLHHVPPHLLQGLTFATYALESLGPFMLFCPVLTGPVRTGAALAFMSLQLAIWSTMDLGTFPLVSASCMVCFLPTWFWDNTAMLRDKLRARLSPAGRQDAEVVGTPREMPIDAAGSAPPMLRASLVTNLLAGFFLLYVSLWNLTNLSSFEMPWGTASLGAMLGLRQTWAMFAPGVDRLQSWYVIPGTLRDGRQVNLMAAIARHDFRVLEAVSWKRPQSLGRTYGTLGWRRYLNALRHAKHSDLRGYFGDYICREWNARHSGGEELVHLQITSMEVRTLPHFQSSGPKKEVLQEHYCS